LTTTPAPTIGVEEEFLLADAATGQVVLAAPQVLGLLGRPSWAKPEMYRFQLETTTRVCTDLDEIRMELLWHRQLVATAAERLGCRLVASGTAPFRVAGLHGLTDTLRYRELARRFTPLVAIGGTCGCHVHVAVPSRDLGAQVIARLRPWLAPLLALSANSPIAFGRDTGWASWRYPQWSQWPTARPPAGWARASDYDAAVRDLIDRRVALDEQNVYFHARLSRRYPTVEVRVADVCLDVDDAVLLTGLVRALVVTAMKEVRDDRPVAVAPARWVSAGLVAAARHGRGGAGVDPYSGAPVSQRSLIEQLVEHVNGGEVEGVAADDGGEIGALLAGLGQRGTGAERQRTLWARARSPSHLVETLADATLAAPASFSSSSGG
jgi:carboxylate-amine ligase